MKIHKYQYGGLVKSLTGPSIKTLTRGGIPSSVRGNPTLAKEFLKMFKDARNLSKDKYESLGDDISIEGPYKVHSIFKVDLSPEDIFKSSTVPGTGNPSAYGVFHPEYQSELEKGKQYLKDGYDSDAYLHGLSIRFPKLPEHFLKERYAYPLMRNLDLLEPYSVEGGTMLHDFHVKSPSSTAVNKIGTPGIGAPGFYSNGSQYCFIIPSMSTNLHPIMLHEFTHGSDAGQGFGRQFLFSNNLDGHDRLRTEMRANTVPVQAFIYNEMGLDPYDYTNWPKIEPLINSRERPFGLLQPYNPELKKFQITHALKSGGILKRK